MDKATILHIITQGENEQTEFKTSFNKEVIETIVAFANKTCGSVYIGISEKVNIVGVYTGKESIQTWSNEFKNKTSSALIPDIDMLLLTIKPLCN